MWATIIAQDRREYFEEALFRQEKEMCLNFTSQLVKTGSFIRSFLATKALNFYVRYLKHVEQVKG